MIKKVLKYILMILTSAIFLLPLAWSVMSSLKTENQIVAYPPRWIPQVFTMENYKLVLKNYPYIQWMLNSIFLTITSTIFVLILASLAAYAFARLEFRGKRVIFTLIISMLLIPIQAYVVPLFLLVSQLQLLNTYAAIILVAGANVTGLFILTSFFKSIPKEIEEAARIDGCKDFGIFIKIILPLSKSALSTVAILTFISNWNNFLWPMIVLRSDNLKPLPVGIAQFMGSAGANASFQYGTSLAGACMAIIPSMIVFLALQRFFIQGIASSGIKG